jgi:hypothetical protein
LISRARQIWTSPAASSRSSATAVATIRVEIYPSYPGFMPDAARLELGTLA